MIRKSVLHSASRFSLFNAIIWIFVLTPVLILAQKNDHHNVTVNVQTVTILQINVGSVRLNITGAGLIAGQDQMIMTDQSTTIMWGTNSSLKKITVRTDLAAPRYTMKILAVSPSAGSAASEATLSTVDKDLILDIGRSAGSSIVRYTGIAQASDGAGSDIHTMTFTIQSQ
jgi:hypothetical protein